MATGPLVNGYHVVLPYKSDELENTDNLVYENGILVSGSLDSLVLHLVPTTQYYPDRNYIFAFLLSSRLFIEPLKLMNRVCQTCIKQQGLKSEKINADVVETFGPHMIRLLGEWTDNFPYDFLDERMIKSLKEMTQLLIDLNPALRRDVAILTQNLTSKIASQTKYKELLLRINGEVKQRLLNFAPSGHTTDITEVCPSPLVLGQQLTHIELERLSMIGPEEFIKEFDKSKKSESKEDSKTPENIEAYVGWFNRLSFFVATEICMKLKKKQRVRIIEYFVDVAKECVNIGNFNSLMAIIGGLSMGSIQRLRKTWAKVHKEKFEILEHMMSPSNNFNSYRSSLKAALWRSESASDDRERIVVPFFSLLVKDIYFINEGCVNQLPNGLVNFDKFWQFAKVVNEFISWKQVECPFDRHPPILNYLLTNAVFSENPLSLASYECEQPENSYERQHYKKLKEEAGI